MKEIAQQSPTAQARMEEIAQQSPTAQAPMKEIAHQSPTAQAPMTDSDPDGDAVYAKLSAIVYGTDTTTVSWMPLLAACFSINKLYLVHCLHSAASPCSRWEGWVKDGWKEDFGS